MHSLQTPTTVSDQDGQDCDDLKACMKGSRLQAAPTRNPHTSTMVGFVRLSRIRVAMSS
jgi:hypothetical protein